MRLTLTQYIDAAPEAVSRHLRDAVDRGVADAANRLSLVRDEVVVDQSDDALRLSSGLDLLAGSEVRISGEPSLTTVEIAVPWTSDDRDGARFRAANIFAHSLATEVRRAA